MERNFFETVVNFFSQNSAAGKLFNNSFVNHLMLRSDTSP